MDKSVQINHPEGKLNPHSVSLLLGVVKNTIKITKLINSMDKENDLDRFMIIF